MRSNLSVPDDSEAWERIGTATADQLADLHGRPLPAALPLTFQSARNIAEDHGADENGVDDAADTLLAAAMRRWVRLATH